MPYFKKKKYRLSPALLIPVYAGMTNKTLILVTLPPAGDTITPSISNNWMLEPSEGWIKKF
jgi:hypothetical protein